MARGFGARETGGFSAGESRGKSVKAMDPDYDRMLSFLEDNPMFRGADNEDDRLIAMHHFANANYSGQFSNLYKAISKIDYNGPDEPENENQKMMIEALEDEYGANRTANRGFGAAEAKSVVGEAASAAARIKSAMKGMSQEEGMAVDAAKSVVSSLNDLEKQVKSGDKKKIEAASTEARAAVEGFFMGYSDGGNLSDAVESALERIDKIEQKSLGYKTDNRGFSAAESKRDNNPMVLASRLTKVLSKLPSQPGVSYGNALRGLQAEGVLSVKDFLNLDDGARRQVLLAINDGVNDFNKNGGNSDEFTREEQEADRSNRIRESVADVLKEISKNQSKK